jgi:hypothetical protein
MSVRREDLAPVDETVLSDARFPEIPLLAQAEVLYERDGGLYECYIPTDLIDHEEVPVKEEWAASLARQMSQKSIDRGGTGQQTAIRLGWIEGEGKFRIIDGFHRDAALMQNGETEVYATVECTDWDTLYDDRIFTAKDHAHVRFSRVVKWIQEVWEHSGLGEDLTVEQAILLYRFDTDGSRLGIDPKVVESAKAWVARKEQQWDTTAMTIHGYLQTAESVDPILVNATRDKKNSRVLTAPTQQIIKMFSTELPNEFAMQHVVWEQAKRHNLRGPQVKALCALVRGKSAEEAQETISEIDVANVEPAHAESQERQLRRAADPRHKGAAALRAARIEIERVNQRVQQSLDRSEAVDADMIKNLNETVVQARALQAQLGSLSIKIAALKQRGSVQKQVEKSDSTINQQTVERAYAHHQHETAGNQGRIPSPRVRYLAIVLPNFGKFSDEDWGSLEQQHRFALILDHPDLQQQDFISPAALLHQALRMSALPEELEHLENSSEVSARAQHLSRLLTSNAPRAVGPIIERDGSSIHIKLTNNGTLYLKEIANNALLAIDDSR